MARRPLPILSPPTEKAAGIQTPCSPKNDEERTDLGERNELPKIVRLIGEEGVATRSKIIFFDGRPCSPLFFGKIIWLLSFF